MAPKKRNPPAPATAGTPATVPPAAPSFDMALLASIAAATQAGNFIYTSEAQRKALLDAGLVEINAGFKNEAGDVATRASPAGIEALTKASAPQPTDPANTGTGAAPAQSAAKPSFVIEDNVPVPTIQRGGGAGAGNVYPFDVLQPGQSFFVSATDERPTPAKSLASTVSSATARYAEPQKNPDGSPKMVTVQRAKRDGNGDVMKDPATGKIIREAVNEQEHLVTRKFTVRSVVENGVKGARVWREK